MPRGCGLSQREVTAQLAQTKSELQYLLSQIIVNVKDYGAKGDGEIDDTESIQEAIDYVHDKGGGSVLIPKGRYMIKSHDETAVPFNYLRYTGGIHVKSGVRLIMHRETVLKAIPHSYRGSNVIRVTSQDDVVILGGVVEGERYEHDFDSGDDHITQEFNYGIFIHGSSNVRIENVITKDHHGDGINIQIDNDTVCSNVHIKNVVSTNNHRQGMSIEGLIGGVVENSTFKNTNGTTPEAGVDIEPWSDENPVENVVFRDCVFENNNGSGLVVMGKGIKNISVDHSILTGNKDQNGDLALFYGKDFSITNSVIGNKIVITEWLNSFIHGNQFQVILFNNALDTVVDSNRIVYTDRPSWLTSIEMIVVADYAGKKNGTRNLTLSNNYILGHLTSRSSYVGYGIRIESGRDITIKDNYMQRVNEMIWSESDQMTITGNRFVNCGSPLGVRGNSWLINDNVFEGMNVIAVENMAIKNSYDKANSVIINNVTFRRPRDVYNRLEFAEYISSTTLNNVNAEKHIHNIHVNN